MDVLAADPTAAMTDVVVALNGHVDESEVQRACQRLGEIAPRRPGSVTVDFHGARSIDVTALDPLVRLTSELGRQGVPVSVTPAWAEDVMRLTGVDAELAPRGGVGGEIGTFGPTARAGEERHWSQVRSGQEGGSKDPISKSLRIA